MATVSNFSHIYLPVNDVDQAIEFYTNNLGFKLYRKYRMNAGGNASAYVEMGGVLLELTQSRVPLPRDPERTEPRIGLAVDDIEAMMAELQAKGVEVERPVFEARTFWGKQAMIKDPSGNGISLREWESPDDPYFQGWTPRHEGVERLA